VLLVAVLAVVVDPVRLFVVTVGLCGLAVILWRPELGVAVLLAMFLVRYGQRATPSGELTVGSVIAGGSGLLTINNLLGIILALIMVYRLYRENDWSFLNSRQIQIIALATLLLVLSAYLNSVDVEEKIDLGLPTGGQDPSRLIVARTLFLILVVYFIRTPAQVRFILGIFLALALLTAFSGLSAGLSGAGYRSDVAGYRAGGATAFIGGAGNPNRLAMVCTLTLVLVWEYGTSVRARSRAWLLNTIVALLVVTIFMTASRGGVIALATTALLMFARRSTGARPLVYAAIVAAVATPLLSQMLPPESIERLLNVPGLGSSESAAEGGSSIEKRRLAVDVGLEIARRHPFIGVGVGNWEVERFRTDPQRSISVPHNSYLLAFAEGGIFCLVTYLVAFFLTIRQLGLIARNPVALARARADGLQWVVTGVRISLISFMIFSLFADLWESIVFYLLFGVGAVLIRRYRQVEMASAHA
jgi:O-antigen ligase